MGYFETESDRFGVDAMGLRWRACPCRLLPFLEDLHERDHVLDEDVRRFVEKSGERRVKYVREGTPMWIY
jgi:hypothetical protein